MQADFNTLQWWRNEVAAGSLPILSVVAAKYLCVPASSTKCEQTFSQAGIIDTKLRNRLRAMTLEMLVFLKCSWHSSLYSMSHAEKMALLRAWQERATEMGLIDATDRQYGMEDEDEGNEKAANDRAAAAAAEEVEAAAAGAIDDVDLEFVDEQALLQFNAIQDGQAHQEDDSGDESDDGLGYDDDSYWSDSSEDELSYSEEKESD